MSGTLSALEAMAGPTNLRQYAGSPDVFVRLERANASLAAAAEATAELLAQLEHELRTLRTLTSVEVPLWPEPPGAVASLLPRPVDNLLLRWSRVRVRVRNQDGQPVEETIVARLIVHNPRTHVEFLAVDSAVEIRALILERLPDLLERMIATADALTFSLRGIVE